MAKRRTSGIQRRSRASDEALERRLGEGGGLPVDWRILVLVGVLLVGLVVGVLAFTLGGGPDQYFGQVVRDDGTRHVTSGVECRAQPQLCEATTAPYSSMPATSGPHWGSPAEWGVYGGGRPGARGVPVSESQVIHNLEHGGIVIWYQPELASDEDVSSVENWVLGQIRTQRFKVIVSPWEGPDFDHPWAVTAWRHLLYLDDAPLDGIRGFFDTHYGRQGPEPAGGPGRPADQ